MSGERPDARSVLFGGAFSFAFLALISLCTVAAVAAAESGPSGATLTGAVGLLWGDGPEWAPAAVGPAPVLTDRAGHAVELSLPPDIVRSVGGVLALNGSRVTVDGSWTSGPGIAGLGAVLHVDVLRFEGGAAPAAVTALTGSQPWVSIMCKFSDVSAEPHDLTYFQNMFAGTYPGLDHYWRQVSYDNINVLGSTARGWYVLPQPRSYYVVNNTADLDKLFADCTAVADPDVYYPNFVGVNLMFNQDIGPYAWGGNRWATLDGVTQSWRVTWEPPWGYGNVTVMSHEMGHGFGLPHSCFDPTVTYDNAWDVMSDTWSFTASDPTYGRVGQHTIAYHKDNRLGWLRGPERVTIGAGESATVDLERMALPYRPQPKAVDVPIGGSASHFYTVESRRGMGYDVGLPGEGVIVHEVDTGRTRPAHVQGTNGAAGAIVSPGQVFRDAANDIGVAVTASLDSGYRVAVASGSLLAASIPAVDAAAGGGTSSNLNGGLEPGETVLFAPAWTNASASPVSATGTLSGFTGPAGASYSILDGSAAYGSLASAATASCSDTGNCYVVTVSDPASRPSLHWDATGTETLSSGAVKSWTFHVGRSFGDVPTGQWAYPFIERLLHRGITAGCGGGDYCPGDGISRWQMAVFLATAMTGGNVPVSGTVEGLGAYNCTAGGTSLFSDVPPGDSGCKFIHYIAAKKITAGCGGGAYCPGASVTRWQMAVFLSTAMAGTGVPSSGAIGGMGAYDCQTGGSSVFGDVPPGDPGCKFIHFMALEGVTAGCGGGNYCPASTLKRDEMAVFMVAAFGL